MVRDCLVVIRLALIVIQWPSNRHSWPFNGHEWPWVAAEFLSTPAGRCLWASSQMGIAVLWWSGAGVGVGMLRGGGDSPRCAIIVQDLKASKIDLPKCIKIPRFIQSFQKNPSCFKIMSGLVGFTFQYHPTLFGISKIFLEMPAYWFSVFFKLIVKTMAFDSPNETLFVWPHLCHLFKHWPSGCSDTRPFQYFQKMRSNVLIYKNDCFKMIWYFLVGFKSFFYNR